MGESIQKSKIRDENLFSDNIESSFKKLKKMLSTDVKADDDLKQETTDLVAVSVKFLQEVPWKLMKYNRKQAFTFRNFGWYFIELGIVW